ncbi:hypothetical protein BGZ46_007569 [Entomortierella lignicola]|nr:hypothetical protein BGZ46_007569 [Entomortierella lignicola]
MVSISSFSDQTDNVNFPSDRFPQAIFLDSGGVINDNTLRGPQWIQILEEYMPKTTIGGPGRLWGRANGILVDRLFRPNNDGQQNEFERLMGESENFKDFDRRYCLYWIQNSTILVNQFLKEEYDQAVKDYDTTKTTQGQTDVNDDKSTLATEELKLVQLVLSESEEEQVRIAREAHLHCTSLVRADYPGAVDAILNLKFEQGFEMYTSSGEQATELELTFRTLGISTLTAPTTIPNTNASILEDTSGSKLAERHLQPVFTKLYGPDLIECPKSSSLFYERIFQDSKVDPRDAVVVDDKEYILGWAKVHGARTVLISNKDRTGKELMVEQEEKVKGQDGEVAAVRKREVLAVDHQLSSLADLPALTALWRKHWETISREN